MGSQPPNAGQEHVSASDSDGAVLCLVFTDARGRIVFADNNFLALIHRDDVGALVGEPLHKILGTDPRNIGELLSSIARMGYIRDHVLEIQIPDEESLNIACTGVATYDDQGILIGADLTLCDITDIEAANTHFIDSGDVLDARIDINSETAEQGVDREQTLALGYFTAQVAAVQKLLDRMGGPRVREMVETLVNQAANQHHWPVQLQGGRVHISGEGLSLDAYAVLLEQAVDYGTRIIGRQAILRELQTVDSQAASHLRELAGQVGLRRWLEG
ncbi:MAG: PAS domain-containing protein [Anaerolineae bacterium]|nr:PAS domain-containing protein [Anaerolineae bacterium]